jgi:CP family cyanate transporter-like MFS transporter
VTDRTLSPAAPRVPRAASAALLGAAVFLTAINLRPVLASVAPLVEQIRADLDISRALAGALTTIPVVCMGLGAFLAPGFANRVGTERAMVCAVVAIGAAAAARLAGTVEAILIVSAFVAGVGIALGQALLPAIVRARFAGHAMLVTGMYSMSINVGAAVAAAAAVPIAAAAGNWTVGLAAWALPAAIALPVWLLVAARRVVGGAGPGPRGRLPWRSRRAWQMALFWAGSSALFLCVLAWAPSLYEDRGLTSEQAGFLLMVFTLVQPLMAIGTGVLARHKEDRRAPLVAAMLVSAVGLMGLAVAPLAAPWLWVLLVGIGLGIEFPLMLALFVDYAPDAVSATGLSGMGFGVGYLLAALAPIGVGALRDASGAYELPFLALAVLSLVLAAAALVFRPPR